MGLTNLRFYSVAVFSLALSACNGVALTAKSPAVAANQNIPGTQPPVVLPPTTPTTVVTTTTQPPSLPPGPPQPPQPPAPPQAPTTSSFCPSVPLSPAGSILFAGAIIGSDFNPLTLTSQYRPCAGHYTDMMIQYAPNTMFEYNIGQIEQILTNPGAAPSPNGQQPFYNVPYPDLPADPSAPKLTEISIPIVAHGGGYGHSQGNSPAASYPNSAALVGGFWVVGGWVVSNGSSGGIWVAKEDGSAFSNGQTALQASPMQDIGATNSAQDATYSGIVPISSTDFAFISGISDEIGCGNSAHGNTCGIAVYHIDAQNNAVTFVSYAPAPQIGTSHNTYTAIQMVGGSLVAMAENSAGFDTYSTGLQLLSHSASAPNGWGGGSDLANQTATFSNGDQASISMITSGAGMTAGLEMTVAGKTVQIPHRCDGGNRLLYRQNPVVVYCTGTDYESGAQQVSRALVSPNGYVLVIDDYKATVDKLTKL